LEPDEGALQSRRKFSLPEMERGETYAVSTTDEKTGLACEQGELNRAGVRYSSNANLGKSGISREIKNEVFTETKNE